MVLFPNCKINLGLHVTSKRRDGYHNIETVFLPVEWLDAIEVVTNANCTPSDSKPLPIQFSSSGLSIPGALQANICIKAYHLLKKDFPDLPPILLHLHKTIPTGAGLGGGSSNGAFTLILLNNKFNLRLTTKQLMDYAAHLGSDCPFFMVNQPCYATGKGEKINSLSLDLSQFSFLIVHPGIHIQTAWAFSNITPKAPHLSLEKIIQQPIAAWKNTLFNDFELPVFEKYPQIKTLKETLYQHGALYASLSGSGSAVFGIFHKNQVPHLEWNKDYLHKMIP